MAQLDCEPQMQLLKHKTKQTTDCCAWKDLRIPQVLAMIDKLQLNQTELELLRTCSG